MRPRFEDPIDTAKDMMDNNITLFELDYYYHSWKENLRGQGLDIPEYTFIAENMVSVKDHDEYKYYVEHYIHGSGTHAFMGGNLDYYDLQIAPMEKWWKSSESVPSNPYGGSFLSGRNWIMNEVSKSIKYYFDKHFFLGVWTNHFKIPTDKYYYCNKS
jgi:hypothetical protein